MPDARRVGGSVGARTLQSLECTDGFHDEEPADMMRQTVDKMVQMICELM